MKRKFLSLAIIIAILAACIPFGVYADETDTSVSNSQKVYSFDYTNATSGTYANELTPFNSNGSTLQVQMKNPVKTAVNPSTYCQKQTVFSGRLRINPEDASYETVSKLITEKPFTYSTWLYFDGLGSGETFALLSTSVDGSSKTNYPGIYFRGTPDGKIVLETYTYNPTEGSAETGFNSWFTVKNAFAVKKWNNIAVSYDPTNPTIEPKLYINGVSVTLTSQGDNRTQCSKIAPASAAVRIGVAARWAGSSTAIAGYPNDNSSFNDIEFYDGILTDAEISNLYKSNLGDYENQIDVKIYDGNDELCDVNQLNAIPADSSKIEIDLSEVDTSKINLTNSSSDIYIADVTANKWLECNYALNSASILSLSNFDLEYEHEYKICIKADSLFDSEGNSYKSADQIINFKTEKNISVTPAYSFDFTNAVAGNLTNGLTPYDSNGSTLKVQVLSGSPIKTAVNSSAYCQKQTVFSGKHRISPGDASYNTINNLITEKPFTYSTWLYFDGCAVGKDFALLSTSVDGSSKTTYPGIYFTGNTSGQISLSTYTYNPVEGSTETGFNSWITGNDAFSLKKWNHIVISYDPTNPTVQPKLYINGELKKTLSVVASPKTQCSKVTPASTDIRMGAAAWWNGSVAIAGYPNDNSSFNDTEFYDGILTDAEISNLYKADLGDYENQIDVKIYDGNDGLCDVNQLNAIPTDGSKIEIDLSAVDTSKINLAEDIYIIDETTKENVTYTSNLNDGILTLTDLSLTPNHSYRLVIKAKALIDSDGNAYKQKNQTLSFVTAPKEEVIVSDLSYDKLADGISFTITNGTKNEINPYIYIVCYKGGKISNIAKYEKLSISANGERPYTSGSISYGQADTVRVFVWDSKLSPYASFEPITVE